MITNVAARAQVNIRPPRSQVFLFSLLVSGVGCVALGLGAGWSERWLLTAISLCIGAPMIAGSVFCWLRSQKDVDLVGSDGTIIKDTQTGMFVRTDTRTLSSPQMVDALGLLVNAVQALRYRQPLPDSAGLVRADGTIVPDSKAEAMNQVRKLNNETKELQVDILGALSAPKAATFTAQFDNNAQFTQESLASNKAAL